MKFEEELRKGNFVVGECITCHKIIWPPSDYCSHCFGNVNWHKVLSIGRLVEYSKKDNKVFCFAEFENIIRVMGTLNTNSKKPEVGSKVRLDKCGINQGNYYFEMSLC